MEYFLDYTWFYLSVFFWYIVLEKVVFNKMDRTSSIIKKNAYGLGGLTLILYVVDISFGWGVFTGGFIDG